MATLFPDLVAKPTFDTATDTQPDTQAHLTTHNNSSSNYTLHTPMDTTEELGNQSSPLFSKQEDEYDNSSLERDDIRALLSLETPSPTKASTSQTPDDTNHKDILTKMALV
jgi:hypothetical protein